MAQNKGEEMDGKKAKALLAKKDWRILSGNYDRKADRFSIQYEIKKGDDVSDLPESILSVLKTEKVI